MSDDWNRDPRPLFPGIGLLYDCAAALRFFSRLPVPALPEEPDRQASPDFSRMARIMPLAGLILALPPAAVLLLAWLVGLGPFVAAALALATGVLVTGAMHESGLAALADGFAGGGPERAHSPVHDSRIGASGGTALALSVILRLGPLATLLDRSGALAALALLLAASFSRIAALLPMTLRAPALTDDGAIGRQSLSSLFGVGLGCLLLALVGVAFGLPPIGVVTALVLAPAVALIVARLAERRIGGHREDAIGAAQQLAEIAALIAILAATPLGRS